MRFTIIALAAAFSLISTGQAFAHAHLVTAMPEPQGTVQAAPAEVTMNFTEELEGKLSSIRVEDAKGAEVDTGDSHLAAKDAKTMSVSLNPLQPGTYKVTWNATATDTHKTHGTYTFKVAG